MPRKVCHHCICNALPIIIILASFALASYFYICPMMPEQMASHWNAGEVNGYMPKLIGLFLMPIISLGLFVLFVVIPKIDPLKRNIAEFRGYFNNFVNLIMAFLFYVYLLTLFWNAEMTFNMVQMIAPAFAALFYYVGVLIENAKRNWSIGIRTPWTLSSETVWNKTHKIGGRMFKACGIIALLGIVFTDIAILLIIVPVLITAVYAFAYSYFAWKKQYSRKASKR